MSTPPSAQPPPPHKPRKKRPADVVSFEDLLAAHKTEREPGQLPREGVVLIGVDLELQRRMAQGAVLPGPPESIPNTGAPNIGAPNISAPNIGAPNEGTADSVATVDASLNKDEPNLSAPNLGAPKIGAQYFSAPNFDLTDVIVRRGTPKSYPIRPITSIEDVLTSAERGLLLWLWERGRPIPGTSAIRIATGSNGEGSRRLATQAGLIYNTFKNLTRALSTKLALDIVKPEKNLPTVYAVYDSAAILDRQRQAGLTGVIHKNGGARELLTAQGQPAVRRADLNVEQLARNIGAPMFGAPTV